MENNKLTKEIIMLIISEPTDNLTKRSWTHISELIKKLQRWIWCYILEYGFEE